MSPNRSKGFLAAALVLASTVLLVAATAAAGPTGGGSPPVNTVRPSMKGTAQEGKTLTASGGTWTGTQPITYAVQFLRCNTSGTNCVSAAKASTYTLKAIDVGHTIVFNVLATNSAGQGSANSVPTDVVTAAPPSAPINTVRPSMKGTAQEGKTLTASGGTWTGTQPISFAVQFLRCNTSGTNCVSAAKASSYTLKAADVGHTIVFNVLATNSLGAGSANSPKSDVVKAAAPKNTKPPTISGTARDGQTLTVSRGTWTGVGTIAYTYKWFRCSPTLASCAAIGGATKTTYKLVTADVGKRVLVNVLASNSGGSTTAQAGTAVIAAAGNAPANTSVPTISGTPQIGQRLTATTGGWNGTAPLTYAYQWQRCPSTGCVSIAGARAQAYTLTAADVGLAIRVAVTAINSIGQTVAVSRLTAAVAQAGPAGQIKLSNGVISIPVTSVALPARLVISKSTFSPNPVRSRSGPITMRFRITDTRGYVVRGALVFARSTPLLTTTAPEQVTGQDGWVTMQTTPKANFPLANGYNVQFFVRARRPGQPVLAGVSTRRLVQVRTANPS